MTQDENVALNNESTAKELARFRNEVIPSWPGSALKN